MRNVAIVVLVSTIALASCGTPDHTRHARWNPNGAPRDVNWHSPNAKLLKYDANHDGILTRAELIAGLKAEFDAYDTNHKNCLSPDQVRAINQLRVQQDASEATPLVDWNQNGCVDFKEYSATLLSLFDALDKNGDGQLTPDELNPKPSRPTGRTPGAGSGGQGGHGHHRGGGGEGGGDPGGE